jgi:heat shock protein HslJ
MRAILIASAAALLAGCVHHGRHDMSGGHAPGHHGAGAQHGDHAAMMGEWIEASRAPHAPTITFEAGRASGFAGCNRWFADVTHEGQSLRFGAAGATRMMCEEPMMRIEAEFLSAIERTRACRMDGETLVLLDENGAELKRFLRAS